MRFSLVIAALVFLVAGAAHATDSGDSASYHLYPMPSARALHPAPSSGSAAAPALHYYGGPVLSHVKIVSVIWGKTVNPTTVKSIGGFLGAIANSTYVDQMAQYRTNLTGINGHAGTNQVIGRGRFIGQHTIIPINQARKIGDAGIRAELKAQIAAGKLPRADLNTLYMVFFPTNVTISSFGTSCVNFSAYHSADSSTPTPDNLFYGVVPDCSRGFGYLTIAAGHEIAEAISDAIPTPGSHPAYPQAWNTTDGYEIADLCEGTSARLKTATNSYLVQLLYSNNLKRCAPGPFHSP